MKASVTVSLAWRGGGERVGGGDGGRARVSCAGKPRQAAVSQDVM